MCQRLTLEQFGFVLALFSHRRLPPFEFTSHYAFAPRPTSGVRSCTDPPARYYLTPPAELAKTERDPCSRSGPSIFSMSPYQATSSEKSIRFSPLAAARPLTIRSWPEALNAKGALDVPAGCPSAGVPVLSPSPTAVADARCRAS